MSHAPADPIHPKIHKSIRQSTLAMVFRAFFSPAALSRIARRSIHTPRMVTSLCYAPMQFPVSTTQRSLSSMCPEHADDRIGIGYLPLGPEEIEAELELVNILPEFQEAMTILHGDSEQYKQLPNAKKASLAIPTLERTVQICRSSMGFKSVYMRVALRHMFLTYYAAGQYAAANKAITERGDIMDWPFPEHERILRLFLRENQPKLALEWCQKDMFMALFPQDKTVPIKWTMYELIAKTLIDGTSEFHVKDPLFVRALDVLHAQKDAIAKEGHHAEETLLSHEIPHLMSQYGALSLVASHALVKDHDQLDKPQQASMELAESLWRESLEWVQKTVHHHEPMDELATGVDGPFEAWIQTNLGELLLRMKRTDEAMEFLGKALQTQQNQKGGNALALSRVLSKIAHGCHLNGQAVSSEGLFASVLDTYEKETHLSLTDQVEYALALRSYGALLNDWDKRAKDAQLKFTKAEEIERAIAEQCKSHECKAALHPVFYLPI